MKYGINTIDDFNIAGRTVLIRVDINQPVDKKTNTLKDTTRIKGCIPTLRELSGKGCRLVVLAHQGSDVEYKSYHNLEPHSKVLEEMLCKRVDFVPDVCGPYALEKIAGMKDGEILLLDNVRFMAEEMTLFETKLNLTPEQQAKTLVVSRLAPLASLYVCDAFAAAHRAQPTLIAFEYLLPSAMGRLFEKEYEVLSDILSKPERPCVFVLGGAKIQDAFLMMDTVLSSGAADRILCGGLVGNLMLLGKGIDIGEKSKEFLRNNNLWEYVEESRKLIGKYGNKTVLPVDLSYVDAERKTAGIGKVPGGELAADIGEKTVKLFIDEIRKAKTVFINGPMGIFEEEKSEYGTKSIWQAVADSKAYSVLGGGDSIAATNKYNLGDKFSYICTGGGAMVRFLSREELPVVSALKHSAKKFGNDKNKGV
jgi:phosphoglycerate kinase